MSAATAVLLRAAHRLERDGEVTLSVEIDGTVEACNNSDPVFELTPRAPLKEVCQLLRKAASLADQLP